MGLKRPPKHASHHMVMKSPRKTWADKQAKKALQKSQDLLKKHGIDIDDANNGVYLPHNTRQPPANYHNELHTQEYAKRMYQRLSDADKIGGKDEVLNELERVRREMEQGLFKYHL